MHGSSPLLAAGALACWFLEAGKIFQGLKVVAIGAAGQRSRLPQILFLQNKLGVGTKPSCVPSTQGGYPSSPLLCVCARPHPKAADLKALADTE